MTLKEKIILLLDLLDETLDTVTDNEFYHPGRFLWSNFENYPKRRNLQTTLSRLVKTKSLKRKCSFGTNYYTLTPIGKKSAKTTYPCPGKNKIRWKGNWLLVIYDIPEDKSVERDILRKELKDLGFGFWQKSTWISPFNVSRELHRFLTKKKFVGVISVMEARQIYGIDNKKVASRAWPLDNIRNGYLEIVDHWQRIAGTKKANDQSLKKSGRELLIKYLEIKKKDPQLPSELLPLDWPDKKVKQTLRIICRQLAKR